MSAPTRCHECKHRRGPRSGRMAKPEKGIPPQSKKPPCGHKCHVKGDTP